MNKEKNEIMKERKGLQKKDEEEEEVKRKVRNCWQETRNKGKEERQEMKKQA